MACLLLPITRSGFCPVLGVRPGLRRRGWSSGLAGGVLPFGCCLGEGDAASDGEESPEALFKKELKKRGMRPSPMLGNSVSSKEPLSRLPEGMEMGEELGAGGGGGEGPVRRNGVASADYVEDLANQRERSMSLNSEGLEGLIPRAKLLVTIGGSFFLGFWPLMLLSIGFFSALYIYFDSGFVHDASKTRILPPPYVDPHALLQDERISQRTPHLD